MASLFSSFKKTLGVDDEEKVEEVRLAPESAQEAQPQDVLPVTMLDSEAAEEARLKDWARQKVLQDWKAKASR